MHLLDSFLLGLKRIDVVSEARFRLACVQQIDRYPCLAAVNKGGLVPRPFVRAFQEVSIEVWMVLQFQLDSLPVAANYNGNINTCIEKSTLQL